MEETFVSKAFGFLGKVARWSLISMLVGLIVSFGLLGILKVCFPAEMSDIVLTDYIGTWLMLSVVVGIPPHHKQLIDPDFGCVGNIVFFGITNAITAVLLLFLFFLLSFLDPSLHTFVVDHLLTLYLGIIAYSALLQFGDAIWRKLMQVLP